MEYPRVSVCIPTYNHEAYVAQTIDSALSQRTNFAVELIIGEDCSTDGTRKIVVDLANKYPDQISLRLAQTNQGAGRNFMDLFSQCRGEYVVILEGDDYWTSPDKLQKQVDALDAHPEWAMCFHPATCDYDDGRPSHLFPEEQTRSEYTIYDLFVKDFMATGAVMFRNRLFGELPDWFADVVVGDWTLHLLNAAHGNIGFLPEPMSVYRIHRGGIFSNQSVEFKIVATFKMLTKIDHHLGGKFTREIDENRLRAVRWLIGQWQHETAMAKNTAAQAAQLASKMAKLEARILLVLAHTQQQSAISALRATQIVTPTTEQGATHSSQLEFDLRQIETKTQVITAQASELEAECTQLRSEIQFLKEFYDTWHNSALYRVYRETVRPWRRLKRLWRSSEPGLPEEPSEAKQSRAA